MKYTTRNNNRQVGMYIKNNINSDYKKLTLNVNNYYLTYLYLHRGTGELLINSIGNRAITRIIIIIIVLSLFCTYYESCKTVAGTTIRTFNQARKVRV